MRHELSGQPNNYNSNNLVEIIRILIDVIRILWFFLFRNVSQWTQNNARVSIHKKKWWYRFHVPMSSNFDIDGIIFRVQFSSSYFFFFFFFYYEITCDKLSRRILEICTCWFRVDRVTQIKIAIRDFLPAAPWSAIFKVDIVQRRMQDAERLRNSVAQCMFCYPALISATCDNIFIE